jgi:hypothetical protein
MLEDLEPVATKRSCKTRSTLVSLEQKDREILLSALADTSKWSDKGLSVALGQRGIQLSNESIGRHRRKLCSCYN